MLGNRACCFGESKIFSLKPLNLCGSFLHLCWGLKIFDHIDVDIKMSAGECYCTCLSESMRSFLVH